LEKAIETVEKDNGELEENKSTLEAKILSLEDSLNGGGLEESLEKQTAAIDGLESERTQGEVRLAQLDEELSSLKLRFDELWTLNEDLEQAKEVSEEQIESLQDEEKSLKHKLMVSKAKMELDSAVRCA
jgi:chromosome segregation ATPase